jgi:5-oxoprolinase (ATP-hydrolysing) subunit C
MDVCRIEASAMRMSLQDGGRAGWARYGVPPGGAMDDHAAQWANRLLENSSGAPVLEILGAGARLRFLHATWIAVTGAKGSWPVWRAMHMHADERLELRDLDAGLWSYVAVKDGFECGLWLSSASTYLRAGFGQLLRVGDVLCRKQATDLALPAGVSSRVAPWTEQRDYSKPPPLRVWRGPQWEVFSEEQRDRFFAQPWTVSLQSDRAGYRLSGEALEHGIGELISEPVIPGTIQVPQNGQPIVTMRDGPTVGGYAKLGLLDERDISWFAQVQPGRQVRFVLADEL